MQGKKTGMLPYGSGCRIYFDCFTCPLPDCVSHYGANNKEQNSLKRIWDPYIERELNRLAVGGKG